MKAFVVGGTGFIGRHAARALAAAGHEVTCLVRSGDAQRVLADERIRTKRGDINDLDLISPEIREADVVLFAARLDDREEIFVDWLIDQVSQKGKSLIFCSGTGVLGKYTEGDWCEDTCTEWDDFEPSEPLLQRFHLETRVRAASAKGAKRGIVVRPPAVWCHEAPHMLVSGVCESVRVTGSACYVGDGLNMYSHVHAEDLGDLFRRVVEQGRDGAAYHAVGGEVANRWIAETVSRNAGVPTRSIGIDEAIDIWGMFPAKAVFATSSRSRSPRSRHELDWHPRNTDMLAAAEMWLRSDWLPGIFQTRMNTVTLNAHPEHQII